MGFLFTVIRKEVKKWGQRKKKNLPKIQVERKLRKANRENHRDKMQIKSGIAIVKEMVPIFCLRQVTGVISNDGFSLYSAMIRK